MLRKVLSLRNFVCFPLIVAQCHEPLPSVGDFDLVPGDNLRTEGASVTYKCRDNTAWVTGEGLGINTRNVTCVDNRAIDGVLNWDPILQAAALGNCTGTLNTDESMSWARIAPRATARQTVVHKSEILGVLMRACCHRCLMRGDFRLRKSVFELPSDWLPHLLPLPYGNSSYHLLGFIARILGTVVNILPPRQASIFIILWEATNEGCSRYPRCTVLESDCAALQSVAFDCFW